MKNSICLCLVFLLSLAASSAQAQNLVANPGFEKTLAGWSMFGVGWRTSSGQDAHSGNLGIVDDVLPTQGPTDNWRGVYQNIKAIPGETFNASVWIRTVSVKASQSYLEVQFLDSSNAVLFQVDSPVIVANQPYTQCSLSHLVAPPRADTISVRGVVHMPSLPTHDPEFFIFDDFSLTLTSR